MHRWMKKQVVVEILGVRNVYAVYVSLGLLQSLI